MRIKDQFREGLITNNPVLVQQIGMCATMAITTSLFNGIGMGLSVLIILTCCNVVIAAIRKIIPGQIRLAIFVVVIAGFVTIVDLLLQAFVPALSESLGVFIPLIVVNCIIIGRAEAYCQKNNVWNSFIDGITQGLGYTVVLVVMCIIRELLGSGRFGGGLIDLAKGFTLDGTGAGIQIFSSDYGASILTLPVGGFLTLGFLFAAMQYALKKAAKKKEQAAEPEAEIAESEGKEAAEK
jgi:electron transport complex protein RnfE